MTFLHDCAGCFRALETQKLLEDQKLDCFRSSGYGRWPGNSPDLNPAENIGAILKDRVEDVLLTLPDGEQNNREGLVRIIINELEELKGEQELFQKLLKLFRTRLNLMKAADGKYIKKY